MVGAALLTLTALAYDPRAEAAEPKRALGLAFSAICLALCVVWPPRFRADRRVAGAALGFVALSALGALWGLPAGLRDLGTLLAALGAAWLSALLGPFRARSAARLSALGIGGFSAFFALYSAVQGRPPLSLHGGQGNPNWLGLLLAVTLPLSLDALVALRRAHLSCRALALGASVAQLPALYLSHSRVAWLGVSVASVVFMLALQRRLHLRRRSVLVAAALLLALIVGATRSAQDVPLAQALKGRAWIWEHSAQAAAEAFPFGAGLGRFAHAYLDAQGAVLRTLPEKQAARRFQNATTAHNEYLQAAVETGAVSAILLALTLIFGVRGALQQRWLGGALSLFACLLVALADSPLRQPAIASLVGLVLGVPSQLSGRKAPRYARLTPGLLLVLTAFLTRDAARGWLGTRERSLALERDPAQHETRLTRAARLDPGSGETELERGLARLRKGDAQAAREALLRADALFADTATRIALGQAELALGRPDHAARAFERALDWNFGSYRAHLGLSEAHFRKQQLERAEREAQIARSLLPFAPGARELIDRIHEAQMDR
jgi:tetratricopeptide (TPR) repeat protein